MREWDRRRKKGGGRGGGTEEKGKEEKINLAPTVISKVGAHCVFVC